ncbi:MAG: universal stress protein [Calditrichae bacterium]|nr:universal stress protein [Calditrichota bacterium]MCB9059306.1 universal stress protein [Calditrichia bacterium]
MVKSILIPLDPSPYTDAAIQIGCLMAKYHSAQLTGLVVLDIPGIEKSVGPVPMGGQYYAERLEEKHRKIAQDRIDQLLDKFREKCEEAGVDHKEAQNQGSPSEAIIHEAIYYDMIIGGLRTHYHFDMDNDDEGESLEKFLSESITPIYGVPKELNLPGLSDGQIKALIPFNASLPSARALQRFAQFMIPEMTLPRLVMSSVDEEVAKAALDHAKNYLELHGFKNIMTDYTDMEIKRACKEKFLDWADVVVVGAHSKRGIFDFMVGSLTKHLIKLDKIPVLVGQ